MKILVLSNLYPPHHAGTFDLHCETIVNALRLRGHTVLVLTSNHGVKEELRNNEVERRLHLNGIYDAPPVTKYLELKTLELFNNEVLRETISNFQPDIVHVFNLRGLSKSLIFTLRHSRIPTVFDVSDYWLSTEMEQDPWLRFWNAPSLPFFEQSKRTALEISGERGRLDTTAPTRPVAGCDRIPSLFGKESDNRAQNSIPEFHFERIYFCSRAMKQAAETAGFCVNHGEVIHHGIPSDSFYGEIKPMSWPIKKFLLVCNLIPENGVMTALKALKKLHEASFPFTLSIYGRGNSSFVAEVRSFVVTQQLPVEFLTVSNLNVDMPSIYKKHDVYLYTPEWPEPFPTAPLEAMACGIPVIGTSIGGASEIFRHGENALTFTPGDVDQLAGCMQEIHMSPALRHQMAETAQSEVLSQFNDSTIIDQVENYLTHSQQTAS